MKRGKTQNVEGICVEIERRCRTMIRESFVLLRFAARYTTPRSEQVEQVLVKLTGRLILSFENTKMRYADFQA